MITESQIINSIDIQRLCKREINKIFKLIKTKGFDESLAMQDELALLVRGTYLKLKSLKIKAAHEEGDIASVMALLSGLASKYGSMYDKKEGRTTTPGTADNPQVIKVVYDDPKPQPADD